MRPRCRSTLGALIALPAHRRLAADVCVWPRRVAREPSAHVDARLGRAVLRPHRRGVPARRHDDPGAAHSKSHDLVCNGQELGGGSIRIHSREMQQAVFRALNLTEQETKERFSHMLEAFEYGAPPHGGIAMGLDRAVSMFTQDPDLREVIAFPKTKSASDPMTGAPLPVSPAQLDELGLQRRQNER